MTGDDPGGARATEEGLRPSGGTPPAGHRSERDRIRAGVLYCLKVFLALRVALFLLGLLAVGVLPALDGVDVPGWPAPPLSPGPHNMFTAFERQDALWFLRIATLGYGDEGRTAAFFPLYPLLIRALSPLLGGHPLAAALVVSNAAFAGALIALYFLSASELSEAAARRAVLYLAVFPTSFFFLAPYSESPFLLLSILAFWGARRGRWAVAGLAGAGAAATRAVGIVLAPALLVEAVHQVRERRPGARSGIPWAAVVGLGTVAVLAWWGLARGDATAPLDVQSQWQREQALPWVSLWWATREAFRWFGVYPGGYHLLDWIVVVPALGLAGIALARLRPGYAVYAWASILVPLSLPYPGRPLLSMPRFLAVVFPLVWALAMLTEGRPRRHEAVLTLSAGLLGLLATLFANWYFIF
ncbi:MAG: hypothetical protein HY658_09860 [Actinobacteria bacterium]|nr:hypothetical protein [Actinomycetota bacterium]